MERGRLPKAPFAMTNFFKQDGKRLQVTGLLQDVSGVFNWRRWG